MSCIVIQGTEIGFFENRYLGTEYTEWENRKWVRVNRPQPRRYYSDKKIRVQIHDENLPENALFCLAADEIHRKPMADVYYKIMQTSKVMELAGVTCPKFDVSTLKYDLSRAKKIHAVELRNEHVRNGEIVRQHAW